MFHEDWSSSFGGYSNHELRQTEEKKCYASLPSPINCRVKSCPSIHIEIHALTLPTHRIRPTNTERLIKNSKYIIQIFRHLQLAHNITIRTQWP